MHLNIAAILASMFAAMVIGGLWYSPLLFAKHWMPLVGKCEADCQNPEKKAAMQKCMAWMMLAAVVTASIMAIMLHKLHVTSAWGGIKFAFLVWLGFLAAGAAGDYIFAGRPLKLYAIVMGERLLTFVTMGALLGGWR